LRRLTPSTPALLAAWRAIGLGTRQATYGHDAQMTSGDTFAAAQDITPQPPDRVHPVLLRQFWADAVFLHWPVPAARVQPLMPAGVRPDVYRADPADPEGTTWVGLIHFRMQRFGFGHLPGIPWLGSFVETNVRLYSVDRDGQRGVVFRSLDADRALPVVAARTVAALPYNWAPSRVRVNASTAEYNSVRRWPGPRGVRTSTRVSIGEPITTPTGLEHFLTARWALHTSRLATRGRTTVRWPNEHPQWPLHRAQLDQLEDDAVEAAGLPGVSSGTPASVLYSPGVPVSFGPWRRLTRDR